MAQQHRIGKVATTIERQRDGTIRVVYHNTAVVTVDPRGRVTLDHGGWMTQTTKTRMNQAAAQLGLDYYVSQRHGEWYVMLLGRDVCQEVRFDRTPFTLPKR